MAETQISWVPFYEELADKLMNYRDDSKSLLDWIYRDWEALKATSIHDLVDNNDLLEGIDPFTVYSLFNKQISNENRKRIAGLLKEKFGIEAEVPSDLGGIPVVRNQTANFLASET